MLIWRVEGPDGYGPHRGSKEVFFTEPTYNRPYSFNLRAVVRSYPGICLFGCPSLADLDYYIGGPVEYRRLQNAGFWIVVFKGRPLCVDGCQLVFDPCESDRRFRLTPMAARQLVARAA